MALAQNLESITLEADSSVAVYTGPPGLPGSPSPHYGHQYTFVKVTGANTCGLAVTKATDRVVGVLQNKPQATGDACTVAVHGVSVVQAGDAITAAGPVAFDTTGRAIPYTGSGDQLVGIALSTVAAANQLVTVLLKV